MSVEIHFEGARGETDGVPTYQVGDEVKGRFSLVVDRDTHARGVQLQVACFVHGSGTAEAVDIVPEHFAFQGDLQSGIPVHGTFSGHIPAAGPLTYEGRRIKFDWEVRVRVDIPFWRDQRFNYGFCVVPRQRPEESVEE